MFNCVVVFLLMIGCEFDFEMVCEMLCDILLFEEQKFGVFEIIKKVVYYYGFKVGEIKSKNNLKQIVFFCQVVMFFCKCLIDFFYLEIGKYFNDKYYFIVMYLVDKIEMLWQDDGDFDCILQCFEIEFC